MKTSLTKLSSSFVLLSLSFSLWAKPVAQVTGVKGTVFVVTPEGETSALKLNQHIEDKAEIMAEEGATITLNDYYDATYHLIGGSHLKFFNQSVQLKKGKAWIESKNAKHSLALTTANGLVTFQAGEFITTFDHAHNRTQVLVVNGEVEVSNILDKNMKYSVPSGTFTMVDPEVENGLPRSPTKVGLQSLNTALGEFKHLPEKMVAPKSLERSVASVTETAPVKKGEIIFITSERKPASVEAEIAKKYFKKLSKKSQIASVPITFYGTKEEKIETVSTPRTPASIHSNTPNLPKQGASISSTDPEFTQSLKKHEDDQPKYRKELQNLIDELRSY